MVDSCFKSPLSCHRVGCYGGLNKYENKLNLVSWIFNVNLGALELLLTCVLFNLKGVHFHNILRQKGDKILNPLDLKRSVAFCVHKCLQSMG